jgi:hypothetical protein
LKPEYDKLLSNFAFSFNLRRYTMEELRQLVADTERGGARTREARADTRPLLISTLAVLVSKLFCIGFVTSYDPSILLHAAESTQRLT